MKVKKLLAVIVVLFLGTIYIEANIYKKPILDNLKDEIEVLSDISTKKEIGKTQAIKLVKDYLQTNNSYIASNIEVDSVDNKYYIVHVYDVISNPDESHTATIGWYQVNKHTGEIINIMQ
ncbi:hypothetical protein [Romboutsia sp.]|uniref:hypothetical protein n=1 Tax=Romboutsia sp. TaxID=1965302 RepID=UPI003F3E0BE0